MCAFCPVRAVLSTPPSTVVIRVPPPPYEVAVDRCEAIGCDNLATTVYVNLSGLVTVVCLSCAESLAAADDEAAEPIDGSGGDDGDEA